MTFTCIVILFILLAALCLNISIFYYALIFIILLVCFLFFINAYGLIVNVFSLLFLIIYIGAIMVILAYVCSVLPNEKTYSFSSYFILTVIGFFLFILWLSVDSFRLFNSLNSSDSLVVSSQFFYSSGFYVFIILICLLLILLLVATNSFNLKSTLRRV